MPGRNERGDVDAALERPTCGSTSRCRMAANHHNPMEAPSTVAAWDGEQLTIHESTMGVRATQLTVAHLLGLPLVARARPRAVRRRLVRDEGDGVAERHAGRDGRPSTFAAR